MQMLKLIFCPFNSGKKKKTASNITSEDERAPCGSPANVRALCAASEPTASDSDEVTKVERFIYAAPVILYAPAALQAVSINN